ncbi:low affinity immunoglobulin gamma Fc region receptor III-A-like [Thunnus thynnus]|uniref:low affinity immunoglobulin gamma Fc region receptor III-A-like n=1 Tax=Thunnus thynnus TaxID=8237 RepID=UPI003527900D
MLVAHIQQSHALEDNAAFARIIPTRLQVFDYSSISFNCEGYTTDEWSVVRKIKGEVSPCVSNWVTTAYVCAIKPAYPTDSGEYWCEAGEGERSNTVNITITAGSVILESPVLPVMEGDGATLRCRSKKTSAAHIADFYKDGLFFGTSSIGEMTIQSVSKSNEGLYKCSISDFGESPESWLAVRARHNETQRPSSDDTSDHSCHIYLVLRTVFTIVMVALLLLLVGLLHYGKLKVT